MAENKGQFKKGHTKSKGKGRPKGSDSIPKEVRIHNRDLLERTVSKYMGMTLEELRAHFENPETVAFDLMLIKILIEAIKRGDQIKSNWLIESMMGKMKERIDLSNEDGTLNQFSEEQRLAVARRIVRKAEKNE